MTRIFFVSPTQTTPRPGDIILRKIKGPLVKGGLAAEGRLGDSLPAQKEAAFAASFL